MTLLERRTVFPFTLQYYALFSYKKAECSTCTDPLSRPRRDSAQQPTADDVRLDSLSCPEYCFLLALDICMWRGVLRVDGWWR